MLLSKLAPAPNSRQLESGKGPSLLLALVVRPPLPWTRSALLRGYLWYLEAALDDEYEDIAVDLSLVNRWLAVFVWTPAGFRRCCRRRRILLCPNNPSKVRRARDLTKESMAADQVRALIIRAGSSHGNVAEKTIYTDNNKREEALFGLLLAMPPFAQLSS